MLDGEGGFCVWGKQTPADTLARKMNCFLSDWLTTSNSNGISPRGSLFDGPTWTTIRMISAVKVRREMEAAFGRRNVGAEPVL